MGRMISASTFEVSRFSPFAAEIRGRATYICNSTCQLRGLAPSPAHAAVPARRIAILPGYNTLSRAELRTSGVAHASAEKGGICRHER